MSHEVGERIQIKGELCTILFIGEIEKWPSTICYGVEWDNPDRGKHSGTLDGKEYFKTSIPNSGSFIKETKIKRDLTPSLTFSQALHHKYGSVSSEDDNLYMGSKKIESLGFEKLDSRNNNFKTLETISLPNCAITGSSSDNTDLDTVRKLCPTIKRLDLSYNLYDDIEYVCKLINCFPQLESLNLSGNRLLKGWGKKYSFCFKSVKSVSLASCNLHTKIMSSVFTIFPNIESIDLSRNMLQDIDTAEWSPPITLKEMNISENEITALPTNFCTWNIQRLDISRNEISERLTISSNCLKALDISHNMIESYELFDYLNTSLPALQSLRVDDNPLFSSEEKTENEQLYEILARFENLTVVNGSIFNDDDRKEAELYFISKILKGKIPYNTTLRRWICLTRNYKIQTQPKTTFEDSAWIFPNILTIKIDTEGIKNPISLSVLPNYTIRYLKGLIKRKLNLGICILKLYYAISSDLREEIITDFSTIDTLGIKSGNTIYMTILKNENK